MLSEKKLAEYGDVLWYGKKHICGLSITFTHYIVTKDKVFIRKGLLSTIEDRLDLFRVLDFTFKEQLSDKIFRTSDLLLHSNDKTHSTVILENIKEGRKVWNMLEDLVTQARKEQGVVSLQNLGG